MATNQPTWPANWFQLMEKQNEMCKRLFVRDRRALYVYSSSASVRRCVRTTAFECVHGRYACKWLRAQQPRLIHSTVNSYGRTQTHIDRVFTVHTRVIAVCALVRALLSVQYAACRWCVSAPWYRTRNSRICFMRLYFFRLVACVPPIHFFLSFACSLRRSQYLQCEHCSPLHTMVLLNSFSCRLTVFLSHTHGHSLCIPPRVRRMQFSFDCRCIGPCVDFQAHRQWPSGANLLPARFNTKHRTHAKKMSSSYRHSQAVWRRNYTSRHICYHCCFCFLCKFSLASNEVEH